MKPFVIVLGAVFLIAGLFAGLSELSVTSGSATVKCGGAFDDLAHGQAVFVDQENDTKYRLGGPMYGQQTNFVDLCESKKETYKILAWVAGVLGLGLVVGGCVIPSRREPDKEKA